MARKLLYIVMGIAAAGLCLIGAATGFLYLNQDRMIFPAPPVKPMPAEYPSFHPLHLAAQDGEMLNLVEHPAEDGEAWVIVFHGNGGDAIQILPEASAFEKAGFGVLVAEYRGYNGSSGSPSQEGLYSDALSAFDYLDGKSDNPIFLYGHSLGTAMAIHAAENRQAAAVVLLSPFDSLLAVAQGRYPFLPVRCLLRHPFPSVEKISRVSEPIAIFHGDADRVVPFDHGQTLHHGAGKNATFTRVRGAGHNDLLQHGVVERAAAFFRSKLIAR